MITTAAAILGAAVLGAGATAISSSNASHAAHEAADAQTAATNANIAENQREFDTIQNNNAPFRAVGTSAINALGSAFGLSGYGAPSMTGRTVASTPVPGAVERAGGGISMTAGTGDRRPTPPPSAKANGGAPTSPLEDPGSYAYTDGFPTPSGAPGAPLGVSMVGHNGGPTFDAYNAANPDISSEWNRIQAGGGDPRFATEGDYLAWHDQNYPQENRPSYADPTAPDTGQPGTTTGVDSGSGAPPGYNDPTAPNGYTIGARPDPGSAPVRMTAPSLDISLNNYQKSPYYDFVQSEGLKGLDHTASSMGGLMSGARVKAAERFNNNLASTDYTNWRDYTTNEFNLDRSRGDNFYTQDLGQYDANRARSDGLYADDRSYDAGRYDTRTSQLLTLAGFGSTANGQNQSAATTFAQSDAANRTAAATASGNAAINSANGVTAGVNNLVTTGAYLGGRLMTSPQSFYGVNAAPPTWAPGETDMTGLY